MFTFNYMYFLYFLSFFGVFMGTENFGLAYMEKFAFIAIL